MHDELSGVVALGKLYDRINGDFNFIASTLFLLLLAQVEL